MKKLIALALAFVLNISCSNAQDKLSEETLNYKLTNTEGKTVSLKEIIKNHQGKPIVLEFWASWCGDCVKNMTNVKKLQAENPNVAFVFLSFDKTAEAWKTGMERHELQGDNYLVGETMKGNFAKSLDVNWIPRYIVLDKNGNVALFKAVETDNEKVASLLKELVK